MSHRRKRLRILEEFTRGELDILVATDVACPADCIFLKSPMSSIMIYLMIVKTMCIVLVVLAALVCNLACEEYALNSKTYRNRDVILPCDSSVSKYNTDALLTELSTCEAFKRRRHLGPRRN
ncbi:unnamed protein product [Ranitomeya imitator]|uniref:Uncharacterized protein n=1 Tax=Ranitomeya imitator TaxID=111125 RepID=A0ABN9MJH4_9NEOB|nr:unnamed protein product [Ranitomeya imitator]